MYRSTMAGSSAENVFLPKLTSCVILQPLLEVVGFEIKEDGLIAPKLDRLNLLKRKMVYECG